MLSLPRCCGKPSPHIARLQQPQYSLAQGCFQFHITELLCACQLLVFFENSLFNTLVEGTMATLANHGVAQTLNINLIGSSALVTAYAVANLRNNQREEALCHGPLKILTRSRVSSHLHLFPTTYTFWPFRLLPTSLSCESSSQTSPLHR